MGDSDSLCILNREKLLKLIVVNKSQMTVCIEITHRGAFLMSFIFLFTRGDSHNPKVTWLSGAVKCKGTSLVGGVDEEFQSDIASVPGAVETHQIYGPVSPGVGQHDVVVNTHDGGSSTAVCINGLAF